MTRTSEPESDEDDFFGVNDYPFADCEVENDSVTRKSARAPAPAPVRDDDDDDDDDDDFFGVNDYPFADCEVESDSTGCASTPENVPTPPLPQPLPSNVAPPPLLPTSPNSPTTTHACDFASFVSEPETDSAVLAFATESDDDFWGHDAFAAADRSPDPDDEIIEDTPGGGRDRDILILNASLHSILEIAQRLKTVLGNARGKMRVPDAHALAGLERLAQTPRQQHFWKTVIGQAMPRIGWRRCRSRLDGQLAYCYVKGTPHERKVILGIERGDDGEFIVKASLPQRRGRRPT